MNIYCPKCYWKPDATARWICTSDCQNVWNTFETRGVCPKCNKQWERTKCSRCGEWSAHYAWYNKAAPPIERIVDLYLGNWVGRTMGYTMPAHIWEFARHSRGLQITTHWEGESGTGIYWGLVEPQTQAVIINTVVKAFKTILIGSQHFVIPGWCTNDKRGGVGNDLDVVFSRPGIAELSATQAYARYCHEFRVDDENTLNGEQANGLPKREL